MSDTPDEIREAALRAVKWLKTSRAKAAPDALNTIMYLAARESILERRLYQIWRLSLGQSVTSSEQESDDPAEQA